MKVSKEVVVRNREHLLEAAGRLLREHGLDKVRVADVAAAAGLTHGALYAHFPSKEALCTEAIARMLDSSAAAAAQLDWKAYVEAYLSPRHVRQRATGCPYTALGADVPRSAPPIRDTFSQGLERALDRLAKRLGGRKKAAVSMALMVGAVVLARAADKPKLRTEILEAAKQELLR
jgi:TetR/AcrR family transcriptional regulator, transcriptional repressor for nem operon